MRFRALLGLTLLLGATTVAQAAKPPALLSPVVSLGPITPVQREIIFNHLQAELSERFELVSQRRYEEAQQRAFEELEFEECTEENCIRYVQDTLQVEVHFSLQLLQDQKVTQLTLALVDLDRKVVKAEVCEGCSTLDLNESVSELVEQMYEEIDFDRLALPYDTRLDPSEKFPELASQVRVTLQVSPSGFFLVPGSVFSSLEDDKTKVEKPYKLTSIGPEIGIGIGRNYLVELRVRPSSGIDIPPVKFTDNAGDKEPGCCGARTIVWRSKTATLSSNSVFYTPNPDATLTWGIGWAVYQIELNKKVDWNETINVDWNDPHFWESEPGYIGLTTISTIFFEGGYQWTPERYPIQIKGHLSTFGFGVLLSTGFRFFL